MHKIIPVLITVLYFNISAKAQTADSVFKKSPVRTLTDAQYAALLNGDDIYNDVGLVARINHYPMPDKALKYKKEADLSPAQQTKITAIAKELRRKRIEMGNFIIINEKKLDGMMRAGGNEGIIFYSNRSGLYYGELRNAILLACYNTWKLLSLQQVKKLETLPDHN